MRGNRCGTVSAPFVHVFSMIRITVAGNFYVSWSPARGFEPTRARDLMLQHSEGLADGFFVNQSIGDVLMKDARDQRLVWKTFFLGSSFQFFQNALCNPYVYGSALTYAVNNRFDFPLPFLRKWTIPACSILDLPLEGIEFGFHCFFSP